MLQRRDIIEILHTDENGRHKLRRVRVRNLRDLGDSYRITGENLKGENPIDYTLPKRPYRGTLGNFKAEWGWCPTAPIVVGEE